MTEYLDLSSLGNKVFESLNEYNNEYDVLNLSDNQLTSLPKSIVKFTRLTTLDLSNNQLTIIFI